MKPRLLVILAAVLAASCSSPKYTYKFDYHDYNAGRKDKQVMKEVAANPGPVEIQPEMLVAEAPVVATENEIKANVVKPRTKAAPLTLSKSEMKAMVKDFKGTVKKALKSSKADDKDQGTKVMDHDLKLSLIFLVVAVLAGALYPVSPYLTYIVGTVAFILAVVFFVKWVIRQ